MGHHFVDDVLKNDIAAGVIAMVVGVDQQIDATLALFADFFNQVCSGIRELGVDHYQTFFVDHPGDRSAPFGEDAYVVAQEFHFASGGQELLQPGRRQKGRANCKSRSL